MSQVDSFCLRISDPRKFGSILVQSLLEAFSFLFSTINVLASLMHSDLEAVETYHETPP